MKMYSHVNNTNIRGLRLIAEPVKTPVSKNSSTIVLESFITDFHSSGKFWFLKSHPKNCP